MKRTTLARLLGSFMVVCALVGAMSVECVVRLQSEGPFTVFGPVARWLFQGLFAAFAIGGFLITGMGQRPSWIATRLRRAGERPPTERP